MAPHPYLLLVVMALICTQTYAGTDFDIRLSGGPGQHVGRVEVFYNGSWTSVPYDCNWDSRATNVACRMLGYSNGQIIYYTTRYGNLTEAVLMTSINCTGIEDNLADCVEDECSHKPPFSEYPISVFCYDITDIADIAVRLRGDPNPHVGRVEVYYSGHWGSVCDNNDWDDRNAIVTCRMLGYSNGHYISQTTRYGILTDPVWMTGVDCNGTEDSLADCSFDGWGQVTFCKSFPASVSCSNITVIMVS